MANTVKYNIIERDGRRSCVVALLVMHAALLIWADWRTSPNRTELGHMAAGLYAWQTARFDVFHTNPPLVRLVATAAVVLCGPNYDWSDYSPVPADRCEWPLGRAFVRTNDGRHVRWYFFWARCACLPFSLLGGYLTYRFSRDLFGNAAGWWALTLWCFSPAILAWGATICPDAAAASLSVAAVYAFWLWLREPRWNRAAMAGLALGLAELTKFTLLIYYPLWLLVWPLYRLPERREMPLKRWRRQACQLALALLLSLSVIHLGYGFERSFQPLGDFRFQSRLLAGAAAPPSVAWRGANRFAGTPVACLPAPLPADMLQGIDTQRSDFERGLPSYFRGAWADSGWWHYYLYALGIKEPLGAWCLAGLAVVATSLGLGLSAHWRDEMVLALPLAAILALVSSQTGFSSHLRYVVPALPLLFIWMSKMGKVFETRTRMAARRALAAFAVVALAWSISSSLNVFPHSLSYFNELAALAPASDEASPSALAAQSAPRGARQSVLAAAAGVVPRNAPRHLLQSNFDWGQDLYYLEDWCAAHPHARPIRVAYCGGYSLEQTEIDSAGLPPPFFEQDSAKPDAHADACGPLPGWYAVSANEIYSRSGPYRYFRAFAPVATAGYSIYLFHIALDEANRERRRLGLAELAGDWQENKPP